MAKAFGWLKSHPHVLSGVFGWLLIGVLVLVLAGSGMRRADLTKLAPAETLLYLETRDLGAALSAITSSKAFRETAARVPDISALDGMQVAIAVTGFEASESKLNEESSEATFRPRFVAIAETPFWGWQARRFVEGRIGDFVRQVYGGNVNTVISQVDDFVQFDWHSEDGRRTVALVRGSRIYFSNDMDAINKCLAVEWRMAESLAGNSIVRTLRSANQDEIAFGYLSPDGVAQLSSVAGLSAAMAASDNELARSFIARTLPQIVRGTVKDISWVALKSADGIEDRFEFSMNPATARTLASASILGDGESRELDGYVAEDAQTVTRYDVSDASVAWKTMVETAASATDTFSAKMMTEFAGRLFEPYGVGDSTQFLKAVRGQVLTARFDSEGEESVAVAAFRNVEELRASLTSIDFKPPSESSFGAEVWHSEDGEIAAAFIDGRVLLGETESVMKCLEAKQAGRGLEKRPLYDRFSQGRAAAVTLGKEEDTAERVVEMLSDKKDVNMKISTNFLTETRFNDKGFQRRTVSPFGFLGTLVAQFSRQD